MTERFQFPKGVKCYTLKIPKEILTADKKLLFATVRGIFDTDGCVHFSQRKVYKKPYLHITISIASKPLHFQLKEILSKEFALYTYENKKRKIYNLNIYGHSNLKKWLNLIGFSNNRHKDKISKFIN